MLDRIGRVVVRRHLAVVVVALVVAAVAGVSGGGVQSKLSHGGFDDPSAESTAATAALVRDFAVGETQPDPRRRVGPTGGLRRGR